MTWTQIAQELKGPIWEAARCTDLVTACLELDRARAAMWRWHRTYTVAATRWRIAGCHADRLWQEMGVAVAQYRDARLAARCWRRQVTRLDNDNTVARDEK